MLKEKKKLETNKFPLEHCSEDWAGFTGFGHRCFQEKLSPLCPQKVKNFNLLLKTHHIFWFI